jgi:hypothetical protein
MIAATFHGTNHYIPNYDESSIEVFENIGHAISALFARYESHGEGNLEARYLNGGKWRRPFHVELGDSFECYVIPDDFAALPGDDAITLEALTAVHAGLWSYKLRLMRPWNFPGDTPDSNVAVAVEKRVAL